MNDTADSGRASLRQRARTLAALFAIGLLFGCGPAAEFGFAAGAASTAAGGLPEEPEYEFEERYSMRGDPDFDEKGLSEEVRRWHERLRAAMLSDDQAQDATRLAESDDAYEYGRGLYTYNQSLLLGLRVTGDLRYLDEVDRVLQIVRGNLADEWCDGVDPVRTGSYGEVDGDGDGYLNFRRRFDEGETYCRDSSDLEEAMVHGHLAMAMHAFEQNRDLESPGDVDYGERADFWLEYLLDHFEAKWRERSGVEFPEMDFIDLKFCHTLSTFGLYYYYVGRTLEGRGEEGARHYLEQARTITDSLFETPYRRGRGGGFIRTDTPIGEAVVYSFGAPGRSVASDSPDIAACPTTYARYMIASVVQLRLEGFYRWDENVMRMLANGIVHFVLDEEGELAPLAAGVTGGERVAGIPASDYRDGLVPEVYALSSIANLMPWDDTRRLQEFSRNVFRSLEADRDEPRRVHLPASFLLDAYLREEG